MNDDEGPDSRPRSRLSAEMITALSAVLIGVCAIAVSLYETSLMRQQLKGSVWPHLGLGFTYNDSGFRYQIGNSGVGPARIIDVIVRVDGQPVETWKDYFESLDMEVGNYLTSWLPGRVLAPNASFDPLVLTREEDVDRLYGLQSRVTFEICYCSVLDDCWIARGVGRQDPVEGCQTSERPLFAN